uniref:G-protein coupled receptors family 2 profile 1 domain-containing protein n=1 Tax=Tetranychus urticae TaxID=32264 RepID=T1L2W7_TETUR
MKHFELQVQTEGEEEEDGESDVYLVSNRRQCQPSQSNSIEWETVDASVMASKPCPLPYTGTAYRACYSMGHWEEPDLTECRLPHLREIQNLIFYHVHKHLVDGLYPLAEELNRLLQSPALPIHSPMDKLDALDSLNSILKTKLRIKLDDEDRDVLFIKSLISSSEQLLTQLPLAFPLETEKNALLTMKSVETIFGLKSLSESLLRALIVFCNDGTIRQIKSFNPITTNIALTLTHVTPFGDHISLLHSEDDSNEIEHSPSKPKANIFLEDFRRYGMGISEIYLKNVDKDFDSDSMSLVTSSANRD